MSTTVESLAMLLGESVALSDAVAALERPGRGLARLEQRVRTLLAAVMALPLPQKNAFAAEARGAAALQAATGLARKAAEAAAKGEEGVGESVKAARDALDAVLLWGADGSQGAGQGAGQATGKGSAAPGGELAGLSQKAQAALVAGYLATTKAGKASSATVGRWLEGEAPLLHVALMSTGKNALKDVAKANPQLLKANTSGLALAGPAAAGAQGDANATPAASGQQAKPGKPAATTAAAAPTTAAAAQPTDAEAALLNALRSLLRSSDSVAPAGAATATATATASLPRVG